MAIQVKAFKKTKEAKIHSQIIVPIRFMRACTGPPQKDCPDVDARGFEMGTRPGTWGATDTRGAMVSVTEGDIIKLKVSREDIDESAPLYITSTDEKYAQVISPNKNDPLAPDGIFEIKGLKDSKNKPVKIQVHLGAPDGPVIGELEPHIFQLRKLRVKVHLVSINGVSTNRTAASMVKMFEDVNKIWRPCGIEFVYREEETQNETINGLAVAGQMTTNLHATPPTWGEFSRIINLRPAANRINIYCVKQSNEIIGLAYDKDVARPNGYGIVIVDDADDNDLAHELGHFLDIDDHTDVDASGAHVRRDIWALRCLMYSYNPYGNQNPSYRDTVGYGANRRGALITVKDLAADVRDGELARARRRALDPY